MSTKSSKNQVSGQKMLPNLKMINFLEYSPKNKAHTYKVQQLQNLKKLNKLGHREQHLGKYQSLNSY